MSSAVWLGRSVAHRLLPIPFFCERVAAGFPSPAQGYVEKTLDLNELCVRHPAATFFVRAQGDSMTGVGIYPNDVLVVDRALAPRHGDIVIAGIDGEFTVKELQLHPSPRLLPRNPAYAPIAIPEGSEMEVFGVVTNVIRQLSRPR
ncbi:MAG: translesion error-prone DNA polymerase V autoproteolytic subunit [Oleiphilaceae bacterium]|nr:translesion error-prone DNA polymerase V autoproteolytic subunit [Oleiphilaceae bacterium]